MKILQKFNKLFFSSVLVFLLAFSFTALAQTSSTTPQNPCDRLDKMFSIGGVSVVSSMNLPKFCTATDAALFAFNLLTRMVGVVTVLFIMYGGYLYLTSAGNDETLEKGKKVLTNSAIGLAVVIMASAIVRIVSGLLQK